MNLTKLTLSNFRCFEHLEVPLDEQLSVIVGVNGSGKTGLLEAAAVAAGTILYAFDDVTNCKINKTDARCCYIKAGSVVDVQPQYPVQITAEGIISGASYLWERSLNHEKGRTTVEGARALLDISSKYQQLLRNGDTALVLPVIAYYGTRRLWDYHRKKKVKINKSFQRTLGYADCLDGTANIQLMMQWFSRFFQLTVQQGKPAPEFTAVQHAIEQCLALMSGFQGVSVQYDSFRAELMVCYRNAENEMVQLPLGQLSDGFRGVLSLTADIAYRMASLNPGLLGNVLTNTDGIVLIDEVDLHLHPAWQRNVLGTLRTIFPKVQFIVSTHAPSVINSVKSQNLVILDGGKALKPESQIYGKDVTSVLNEIMDVPERPQELADLFADFYKALSAQRFDDAEEILNKIERLREYHDPELAGCRVKLKVARLSRREK